MPNDKPTSALEELARDIIGDGQKPNWYLVTRKGSPVMLTTDAGSAYRHWYQIAHGVERVECALEDRLCGCLASVEPRDDDDPTLVTIDDSHMDKALRGGGYRV